MNTNTFLGIGSLANNTGDNNSSVGYYSLFSNLDASSNIAVGSNALLKNKTGAYNSAIGTGSMCFNQSGSLNTAVGSNALEGEQTKTTVGNFNVAVGAQALFSNSGSYSTAIGTYALMNNITAAPPTIPDPNVPPGIFSGNTAVGYATLQDNTTGFFNTASGVISMNKNTTGYQNVAMGAASMEKNTTGFDNTAIGAASLRENTTGENNTAFGAAALEQNTTGIYNVGVGPATMRYNETGDGNTIMGYHTLRDNINGSYNTAIGFEAGKQDTGGSYNTYVGYNTDVSGNVWSSSTALGYNAKIEDNNQIVLGTPFDYVYIPSSYNSNGALVVGGATSITTSCSAASFITTSDYRIKDQVETLVGRTVDKLRPVTYKNKITGKQDIGLIAHEVQELYPELVEGIKDGEKTQAVNYIGLVGVLIAEIQTLKQRLNKIENEIKIKID